MKRLIVVLAAVVMLLPVATANAAPFSPTNVRPVSTLTVGDGPGMQAILDSIFGGSAPNALTDQSSAAMWGTVNQLTPLISPIMQVEYAGNLNQNKLGIWYATDTTSIKMVDIFKGTAGSGDAATLQWTNGTTDFTITSGSSNVFTGSYIGSGIPYAAFGFYIDGPGGLFFTADALNPNGEAHTLAYNSNTNWVFGFEDVAFAAGADKDYNDMVVYVESLKPVPEPGSMLLLGSGLFGLAAAVRRRFRK